MNEETNVTTEEYKNEKFEFTPLMFWEDITYVLQLIAGFIKKLFNIGN